ncbi:ATP-binding cassette domain-containing protein [Microbacterium hydrocarbonoxydans]|uniref:ATP-binding cassette domain-containing protein n=1 Tax=Microbacterium hydrocarbonoxydans TaxID=273678 RepID=UPI00204122C1|nr:ATP-binding cassette domain-containing protein [Microbacterium hydrocarbonoxydans]MCM3778413.1 ATP-binding cassette domain-containing protein [Microbacterium hydrocarbonoxydans]
MTIRDSEPLLTIEHLVVDYRGRRRSLPVRASDDVSLSIEAGETLGLVGESGSGKSTIGNAVLGFTPVSGGRIAFAGEDITQVGAARRRQLTKDIQVIFQNPYASLNPALTIGQTLSEPLRAHGIATDAADRRARIERWLDVVGLPAAAAQKYPSDFSGGQRQRIAIARALLVEPRLVVCDEAVSALDLSIQAQILNLLAELQQRTGVSYLFITHDLAVVEHVAHRLAVLHYGRVVESGATADVLASPQNDYTRNLLDAVPSPDPVVQRARRSRKTLLR